ncbi:MAG: MFS transporter [Promicromonosporaceae bacterium]|nr:MFS transporter [Promicromonosporaceae bacterium]
MTKNKYVNGILPMVLINFAIGSVYCWTLFREAIVEHTGFGDGTLAWAFSIAIFFLGMSAAFGGRIVEKNPITSAWLTAVFFTSGWVITGWGIQIANMAVVLLGFGVVQGLGLGLGYLTPIKTMMIWLGNKKGFAAGLSIAAFGLAGVIANPIIEVLLNSMTPYQVFYLLAAIYGVGLVIAALLLYRPPYDEPDPVAVEEKLNVRQVVFAPKFIFLWLVFFLNITGGLALISREKQIYIFRGLEFEGYLTLVMITAVANLAGRMIMSSLQDKLRLKHTPYYAMAFGTLAMAVFAAMVPPSVGTAFALVFVVQFMFGCGFACIPNILHQNWGMKYLSTVHGLILSAWAIAGLAGNQISRFVMDNYDLRTLFTVLAVLYAVESIALLLWVRARRRDIHAHTVCACHPHDTEAVVV